MVRRREVLAAAASTTLLAGCSGDGGDGGGGGGDGATQPPGTTAAESTPTPAGDDATVTVEMIDRTFDPVTVEVEAGATVAWVNRDGFEHDVTAAQFRDSAVDWSFSETLGSEERTTFTFDSAGVYDYYCTIHGKGTMCGAILVGGASADGSLPCTGGDGSGTGPY